MIGEFLNHLNILLKRITMDSININWDRMQQQQH